MPVQVYLCKEDGEFDITVSFKEEIPQVYRCPSCGLESTHILKPPAGIMVKRTWNENANEMRRDPYTQAKYQATHMHHEQKDMGRNVPMPSEEGLQLAAAKIAERGK